MAEHLERRLGLGLLTAYGVGVMVGAGIYVLVGTVVGHAGIWAPFAFLLAGLVALFSALSYAEFATRLPEAAGQAAYVERGFSSRGFGILAGLAIALTGIISAAAVLRGGVGYLTAFVDWPAPLLILLIGVVLTVVAVVGVLESLALIAVLTLVEVAGLVAVVGAGFLAARVLFGLGRRTPVLAPLALSHERFGTPVRATLLVGGSVLAAALVLPVETLAEAASAVLLAVFVVVNAALIRLHRREPEAPFRVPRWVPWAGLIAALAALGAALFTILSGEAA